MAVLSAVAGLVGNMTHDFHALIPLHTYYEIKYLCNNENSYDKNFPSSWTPTPLHILSIQQLNNITEENGLEHLLW